MKSNELLKGLVLVAVGASSYGMLATFVKLSYQEGFTTPEVALAQLSIGLIVMWCITLFKERSTKDNTETSVITKAEKGDVLKLILFGTSLGLTTLFYYSAVKYVSISIAIVLLMQTTWISVVLESLIQKKFPSLQKIIAVILVLVGTVLTTNILGKDLALDFRGLIFGLLAALSFTMTMFTSNKVATYLTPYRKGSLMLTGGFITIVIFCLFSYNGSFNFGIFGKWGIILALFGTIIPPLTFNAGFPKIGLGLGSIVSAMELPVSIFMAYLLLGEQVIGVQIVGIVLILLAVILMNIKLKK
ncbi:EamA family transporter [Sphingobacteriaceae bacterium WQ 2009]|uniref:EamA family transporter n=1 Tax=Rhinopithecimicrobium faecis TaxID=2820698 RepID=A0A8T4HI23_9SPHI|nr:EamA family transporter [Sphingobacteriaceae bacterium WQ 2009]